MPIPRVLAAAINAAKSTPPRTEIHATPNAPESVVVQSVEVRKGVRLQLRKGDITKEQVDAIVNAANTHLQHGSGVAGALSLAGGPAVQQESDWWVKTNGVVQVGQVAITNAGTLPCRKIIHAVGPDTRKETGVRKALALLTIVLLL